MENLDIGLQVLATDLDGTLIPLEDNAANRRDLRTLSSVLTGNGLELVFVTGRHLALVMDAVVRHRLPVPQWIICDVGTSIFHRAEQLEPGAAEGWGVHRLEQLFQPVDEYQQHQAEMVHGYSYLQLEQQLHDAPGLRKQEAEKQGPFKLSYYCEAAELKVTCRRIQQVLDARQAPYSLIGSVDPFTGDGLIDLLPSGVSKAHALAWWAEFQGMDQNRIVFAGDSGNDLAAFQAGYRAIVVGNTDAQVAREAYQAHCRAGWQGRLYLADRPATSGVLQGVRWFAAQELEPVAEEPHPPTARLGATAVGAQRTHFRVWAPACQEVDVVPVDDSQDASQPREPRSLQPAGQGYFEGQLTGLGPGDLYWYRLRDTEGRGWLRPDPASRFQPAGVHGPSQVVDANAFAWTDQAWTGVAKRELVIYELHIGTFTTQGTYTAAIDRLDELVELGINAIELMPLAQSPGRWNWGYDGVNLFAPRNTYGSPDELRQLVDACHARNLAVLLDVVYNHLGPEGNYLRDFGPYFTDRYHTPWGEAFNFDGDHSQPVREMILENAVYWLREYHLDGLRLDAVHFMHDERQPGILQELRERTHEYGRQAGREVHLIAESNIYDRELLEPAAVEASYDAIWSECLMHAIYAQTVPGLQLTTRDYRGGAEIAEALQRGFLYCSSPEGPQRMPVDSPQVSSRARASLVTGLQTHDAVGNHPTGRRFHQLTSEAHQQAAAALVLLGPGIPMVFMGEEEASPSPFPFFVNFEDPALQQAVLQGRMREYPQHAWKAELSPIDPATFAAANVSATGTASSGMRSWYQSLLALRKRGVAEGWLQQECMRVESQPEQGVFQLCYQLPGGGRLVVVTRLAAPDQQSVSVECEVAGSVLLSTLAIDDSASRVSLPAAAAVLWHQA